MRAVGGGIYAAHGPRNGFNVGGSPAFHRMLSRPVLPGKDCFQVHYGDLTINLWNIGPQRLLDAHFPIARSSDTNVPFDHKGSWALPECVPRNGYGMWGKP